MARKKSEASRQYRVLVERIWHRGDNREYAAGAEISLDHLDPWDILALIEAGVVEPLVDRPLLPLEEALSMPVEAAKGLHAVGIDGLEELAGASVMKVAVFGGVEMEQAQAWQEAANAPAEVKDGQG